GILASSCSAAAAVVCAVVGVCMGSKAKAAAMIVVYILFMRPLLRLTISVVALPPDAPLPSNLGDRGAPKSARSAASRLAGHEIVEGSLRCIALSRHHL